MCANCRYLRDPKNRICGNQYFIKWNGSEVIPGKINEYCSDWYEPAAGRNVLQTALGKKP